LATFVGAVVVTLFVAGAYDATGTRGVKTILAALFVCADVTPTQHIAADKTADQQIFLLCDFFCSINFFTISNLKFNFRFAGFYGPAFCERMAQRKDGFDFLLNRTLWRGWLMQ
jgi:hypothetical protein